VANRQIALADRRLPTDPDGALAMAGFKAAILAAVEPTFADEGIGRHGYIDEVGPV